jgi:hypothetical protein
MTSLTSRQEAEAVEQFGEELTKLLVGFDRLCARMSASTMERINAIPNQEHLDTVATAFSELGDRLCVEDDQHAEAEDRRRDNPLEPDFRRLGV